MHDRSPWRAYLGWMLGTALALVAACGAVSLAVDPLGLYGAPRVAGINAVKPYLDQHRELVRWTKARRLCPKAAIFGNSRAEIGFDPENPAFAAAGLDAFNHAIPGTDIGTSLRQWQWLQRAGCTPRTVVLGVEFFDFLGGEPLKTPLQAGPAPSIGGTELAETVFSLSALRNVGATLAVQRAPWPAIATERGFNPLQHYELEVRQSGHELLFRQRAGEYLKIWPRKPRRLQTADGGPSGDQQMLDALLADAARSGTTVHLVIYPYHAQLRLMAERAGLGGLLADWKAAMVQTAARHSPPGQPVQVWDFSAISAQTSEPVPPAGDRRTRMRNYWEAGHFKKALGDEVLAQVLQGGPGFGVRLQAGMLSDWLADDRQRVQQLLAVPSPLVAEVNRLFAQQAAGAAP